MRIVPLGEVTQAIRTWNPARAPQEVFSYIELSDLDNLTKKVVGCTTMAGSDAPSRARQLLARGDVLVSTVRPNLNAVAVVPAELDGATASTGFSVLRPSPEMIGSYLFHWVRGPMFIGGMIQSATGASYPAVSDRIVKDSKIPLPPLDEQRRIAAILDAADSVRDRRRNILDHLDTLAQAVFLKQFGNPLSPPTGAPTAHVGSIARVVTGNSPSRAVPENFGEEIEWIKSGNLGGALATRAEEGLSTQGRRRARIAPAGSLLVTCIAGSPTSIGKCSLVERDVAFNQQINAILPSPSLEPAFLLAQLKLAPQLVRLKSSGGMKGLVSKSAFESIEILVPPLVAQQQFAARASAIDAERIKIERALAADDHLIASLQSRAFSSGL